MSLVRCLRTCLATAGASAALLVAAAARADGGFPRAQSIFFEPGDPTHILIRSDYWGLFRSNDGGQTWQYGCSELYGGNAKQITRLNLLYLAGGRILVGRFGGLRITDDFCNWTDSASLDGHFVEDLAEVGNDLFAVTADGANGTVTSALWRSTDHGTTWAGSGGAFPTGYIATSLGVAPSDPTRMYVGGASVGSSGSAVIAISTTGGSSWTTSSFTPPTGTYQVRVRAIHPTRPGVVFVRVDTEDDTLPDTVWATSDGGATWMNVYTSQQDLTGLALSPDGTEIRLGGRSDGLLGATVDAALAQGPAAFQKVFDGSVWGLTWTADALYAGNNNFTAAGIPAFTLGKSTDGGKTFSPLMSICQLEFATCDPSSSIEKSCHPGYDGPGGIKVDFLNSSRCTEPQDAGTGGGTKSSTSNAGCTCSLGSRNDPGTGLLAAAGLLAGAWGARKRRRSHARNGL